MLGRELMAAAQSELTIGNLVRRVLFFIREEYSNQLKLESNNTATTLPSNLINLGGLSPNPVSSGELIVVEMLSL